MITTLFESDTTGRRQHAGPLSIGPSRGRVGRPAFTLMELLLVLAIMAVAAAIAAPRYAGAVVRYRADMAARRVVADLEATRVEARVTSESRTIRFYTATDLYTVYDGATPLRTTDLTKPPYEADVRVVSFNGGSVLTFNGYGEPDRGGLMTVCVGDECRTITVDAATGKVAIQ